MDVDRSPSRRVWVRGADGALGRRVTERLGGRGDVVVVGDPDGCDTIVDVAIADHDRLAARGASVTEGLDELIAVARQDGVRHLVVVSSAMLYGAWPNNPVPLTESAVLRPTPDFVYARQLAAAEEAIEVWRQATPDRKVAMLRPAIPVAAGSTSSLAIALTSALGQRVGEFDPDAQFVHLDDLADAVVIATLKELDGVYNVAPDGSVPGDRVRALSGQRPRIPLPERVADVVGAWRWRFQRGPIPPGLKPYTRHIWVVANDRLRAEGWEPTVTNEQAYVEGTDAAWWTMVTPKRRQELALGAMITVVGGLVAAAIGISVRWWRSSR